MARYTNNIARFPIIMLIYLFPLFLQSKDIKVEPVKYRNPVISTDAPDPAVLRGKDNYFYLYSTQSSGRVPVYKSEDLVNWEFISGTLDLTEIKKYLENGVVWAPDVAYYKNQYVMVYSVSKWGEMENNGIGLAVSKNPTGPFENQGMLFTSKEIGVRNSIDPALCAVNRKLYLIWGSFNGIYAIELKRQNGKYNIADFDSKVQIAGTIFEGTHIYKRGKYFYLFASIGTCCNGDKSTYRVVVGRAKSILGPYLNANGEKMLDNKYSLVLQGNEKFVGPGHGSSIITDKDNKTWYIYHSYLRGKHKNGRMVMLDEIKWTNDGWPYFDNSSPSFEHINSPQF